MKRAHVLTVLVSLFVTLLMSVPSMTVVAGPAAHPWLAHSWLAHSWLLFGHDLIRQKQQVPDDPLAGLPTGEGGGRAKGGSGAGGRATCTVKANAESDREIGDLRATLAFVKLGPKSWPCPARSARADIRLRITVDEAGKITTAEPVSGDSDLGNAIAKRLPGKSIGPRAEGATVGIVVVTFASSRP